MGNEIGATSGVQLLPRIYPVALPPDQNLCYFAGQGDQNPAAAGWVHPAVACEGGVEVSPTGRSYLLLSDWDRVPDHEESATHGGKNLLQ